MRNRKIVLISILLSVTGVIIGGVHTRSVWAEAPSVIVLEEEYLTADPQDYGYRFPEQLKEPGITYRLSAVTYQTEVHEYALQKPLYGERGAEELMVADSIVYGDLKEALLPNDRIIDDEGVKYLRRNSSLEVVESEVEKKLLETRITYEGILADSEIPPMSRVEIQNPETGRKSLQEIPLDSYSYQNYRWVDDFWFPITFSVYDAQGYYLGNKIIPYHNEFPALKGCEEDLLRVIGKSQENYLIKEFEWDGEPYTDELGVMRRNAVGKGSRRVADCHALYRGEKEMPSPSYVYHSVYERLAEEGTEFNVEYKIKAKGIYQAVDKVPEGNRLLKARRLAADFSPSFAVVCGGTVIVSLVISLFFLVIRMCKRKGKGV